MSGMSSYSFNSEAEVNDFRDSLGETADKRIFILSGPSSSITPEDLIGKEELKQRMLELDVCELVTDHYNKNPLDYSRHFLLRHDETITGHIISKRTNDLLTQAFG